MTKIEWCEKTWNPIVGCSIVSPGCTNCYAMKMAARIERMGGAPQYDGTTKPSRAGAVWTGKVALAEKAMLEPLKRKKPTMYFVNSMGDLFHEDVPDAWIDRVFAVMALCPQHTFQVLTKRSARMREYFRNRTATEVITRWAKEGEKLRGDIGYDYIIENDRTALPNVWLGVSAEDQTRADERIPDLLATPAAVRFVSAEPLLGPVDVSAWLSGCHECAQECGFRLGETSPPRNERCHACGWVGEYAGEFCPDCGAQDFNGVCPNCYADAVQHHPDTHCIDWVIVGGESGKGARPMHPDWARSLRDQCAGAGVAFFFKQWGSWIVEVDRDKEDPDWRHGYSNSLRKGGAILNVAGGTGFHGERVCLMKPASKKAAGRLLDGRTHDEMPPVKR